MSESQPLFSIPTTAGMSAPAAMVDDDDYPEVMREIADVVTRTLLDADVDRDRAVAIGEAAAESVREQFGGQNMYLPKGRTLRTRQRWALIYAEFDGTNHIELARRHGINIKSIYKILAAMKLEHQRRTQRDLFVGATA